MFSQKVPEDEKYLLLRRKVNVFRGKTVPYLYKINIISDKVIFVLSFETIRVVQNA